MAHDHIGRLTYEHTNCCVIVAHPDDETLWAGGTILMHPDNCWTVVTLCRGSDADRAPRFHKAMECFGARGVMGDLDDEPDQRPLRMVAVEDAIADLLPSDRYDLVLTHGLWGEYTSHRRHEEVAKSVMALRESGRLSVQELWMFAYEDGEKKYLPRPMADADVYFRLPLDVWDEKHRIIQDIYGFDADSFEAQTTPREEAFWILGKGK
ncbi:MAG: PIG-L family deacetylase [Phycisphaerales bacterium]|nr:MAG: PIG-L family deacetylase [Phycisphaerales bacterium]